MSEALTARKPAPDETFKQNGWVPGAARASRGGAGPEDPFAPSGSIPGTTNGASSWPPAPPPWVDDRTTERCMGRSCQVAFDSLLERRHHCRYCGNVFCQGCSSKNSMLPPEWHIKEPQRVCNECFRLLLPHQATWVRQNANAERENLLEDDGTTRYLNSPLRFTLGGEIRKAAYSLQNLIDPSNVNYWERDVEYTTELLEAVEGIMFLTVGKIAFIGGVRVATGLVVARLADGTWSAPCAVGSFGITFGACVGAEVTDMITGIDKESMEKFCNDEVSNLMVGGEASFALGPFGRTASGEVHVPAVGPASHSEAYMSYSQSRGAFGGVTIEAAYVKVREDVNEKFYGYSVNAQQILDGTVPRPKAAEPLYQAINNFYIQVFPDRGSSRATNWPVGSTGYDDDGSTVFSSSGRGAPAARPPDRQPPVDRFRSPAQRPILVTRAAPTPPPKSNPFGQFSKVDEAPAQPPPPPVRAQPVAADDDDDKASASAGFFEPRLVDGPYGKAAEL
ncbi:hypothetical protein CTAYLR_000767 [Chrysophaeum taylorii]|uniref:FYVE-type domain-containing protein n=1 Tax=Chrysophaeum taylorii TaxID=2483200 RepID=A0AAD7XQU8_9STRA|nr:hypothetical protein CTAYLR_000767 [Chrysophaeum taylorii]